MRANTPFAAAGAALLVLGVAACDSSPERVDVVCTDFAVGRDMSAAGFGVAPEIQPKMRAIAAGTSDLSSEALELRVEVAAACRTLGAALGLPDADLVGTDDGAGAEAVCKKVGKKLGEVVKAAGAFEKRVWAPRCAVDVGAQVACEARCHGATSTGAVETWRGRCAAESVRGPCAGTCDGACEPSGDGAVECKGTCDGACLGACKGDLTDAGTCFGTCEGDCRGACRRAEPAACAGMCAGTCSVPKTAATCDDALPAAPSGDADCAKSCAIVGVARAVCSGGGISVHGARSLDAVSVVLEQIGSVFVVVAKGYGPRFKDPAKDLGGAMAHVLGEGDALGQQGGACGVAIAQTQAVAAENLRGAVRGSVSVLEAFD